MTHAVARSRIGTAALLAAAVLLLVLLNREALDDQTVVHRAADRRRTGEGTEHPLAFLKLPQLWMCFGYFVCTTASLSAIQGFASPALGRMYAMELSATAFVVSGYMLAGAVGMIAGGFVAPRVPRLEVTIGLAMAFAAGVLLVVATGWLPGALAAVAVALAGVGTGVAGPSRDLLIKRAAPPGATGRVYGTVYSGVDVSFALASPVFGWLLDQGRPSAVFVGAAVSLALGIAAASLVGARVRSAGVGSAP